MIFSRQGILRGWLEVSQSSGYVEHLRVSVHMSQAISAAGALAQDLDVFFPSGFWLVIRPGSAEAPAMMTSVDSWRACLPRGFINVQPSTRSTFLLWRATGIESEGI